MRFFGEKVDHFFGEGVSSKYVHMVQKTCCQEEEKKCRTKSLEKRQKDGRPLFLRKEFFLVEHSTKIFETKAKKRSKLSNFK